MHYQHKFTDKSEQAGQDSSEYSQKPNSFYNRPLEVLSFKSQSSPLSSFPRPQVRINF